MQRIYELASQLELAGMEMDKITCKMTVDEMKGYLENYHI